MLAGYVGSAVIVRQEIDELAIHFRASPEFDFCGSIAVSLLRFADLLMGAGRGCTARCDQEKAHRALALLALAPADFFAFCSCPRNAMSSRLTQIRVGEVRSIDSSS
jgi:hypothetical protein